MKNWYHFFLSLSIMCIASGMGPGQDKFQNGWSDLMKALSAEEYGQAENLIEVWRLHVTSGICGPDYVAPDGKTALMVIAQKGDGSWVLDELVARTQNHNAKDKLGNSAFLYAAMQANPRAIEHLLKAGCYAYEVNDAGDNAVILTAKSQFNIIWMLETLPILVKAGVNIRHQNKKGLTALRAAQANEIAGKERLVELIEKLEKEADSK